MKGKSLGVTNQKYRDHYDEIEWDMDKPLCDTCMNCEYLDIDCCGNDLMCPDLIQSERDELEDKDGR